MTMTHVMEIATTMEKCHVGPILLFKKWDVWFVARFQLASTNSDVDQQ